MHLFIYLIIPDVSMQGDQPQKEDNYINTVRLANYLNACIYQLQINQLIVIQLSGGVKGFNLQLS